MLFFRAESGRLRDLELGDDCKESSEECRPGEDGADDVAAAMSNFFNPDTLGAAADEEGAEPGAVEVALEDIVCGVEKPGLCSFPMPEVVGVSFDVDNADEGLPFLPSTASETVEVIFAFEMGVDGFESTASDTVEPIFEG